MEWFVAPNGALPSSASHGFTYVPMTPPCLPRPPPILLPANSTVVSNMPHPGGYCLDALTAPRQVLVYVWNYLYPGRRGFHTALCMAVTCPTAPYFSPRAQCRRGMAAAWKFQEKVHKCEQVFHGQPQTLGLRPIFGTLV